MKLLFDQNLSPRLVRRLSDICSDATHVSLAGLDRATDIDVWNCARANDRIIVIKDSDFSDVSVVRAFLRRSFGCAWATALRHKWSRRYATTLHR